MRVDERKHQRQTEAYNNGHLGRAPTFGEAQERGRYQPVYVYSHQEPAGHVKHKVKGKHVKFAEIIAAHVNVVLVHQVVAQESKVEYQCVAYGQYGQIGESGMLSHFVLKQNNQR